MKKRTAHQGQSSAFKTFYMMAAEFKVVTRVINDIPVSLHSDSVTLH